MKKKNQEEFKVNKPLLCQPLGCCWDASVLCTRKNRPLSFLEFHA